SLKITGPGAAILDPTRSQAPAPAATPPDHGPFGAAARQQERQQWQHQQRAHESEDHEGHMPRPIAPEQRASNPAHPAQRTGTPAPKPGPGRPSRDVRPQAASRPPRPVRSAPPRAPLLTDELRAQIEARYLELAQPVEFDGIRTQIATELNTPKSLVKKAVADLRKRIQTPSWWELRSYDGSADQLERIRAAYMPLLPVPPVGVHKQLATTLTLDARLVYQGIRRIRAELHLPQYNAPETHGQQADQAPDQTADEATNQVADQTQQTMMEVG
ncbi:MAG: hypothetical protein ABI068_06570, partial [Ktedonobacterales bacterium]